jgi:HD superfamily phosphohydrolase
MGVHLGMSTVGLSHSRALTPISDPIHVRYEFNLFDRALIDSTYYQRLHFVLQNSVNYVSFPSNKNTRFPHSLGVAHIGGRMFSKGLSQASYKDLNSFLKVAGEFLGVLVKKIDPQPENPLNGSHVASYSNYQTAHFNTISGLAGFLHKPIFRLDDDQRIDTNSQKYGPQNCFSAAFIVDTYWQAIRLYGLMHDIGHLPMSHAFEMALKYVPNILRGSQEPALAKQFSDAYTERKSEFSGLPKIKDRENYIRFFSDLLQVKTDAINESVFPKEFHEVRGISIFNRFIANQSDVVPPNANWAYAEDISKYANLIYFLALSIILSSSLSPRNKKKAEYHPYSFLYGIRRLIDGEVDADRLDYTLRDCLEAGSKLGSFDLERVISNSLLIQKEETGVFGFGFYFRGISGVEQFYEQRYNSYKYLIHHRTASRSNKCLELLIALILSYAFRDPNSLCTTLLIKYGYLARDDRGDFVLLPDSDDVIERIDDAGLRTLLFELKQIFPAIEYIDDKDDPRGMKILSASIRNLIDVVLLRKLDHVATAFKNASAIATIRQTVAEFDPPPGTLHKFLSYLLNNQTDFVEMMSREFTKHKYNGKIYSANIIVESIMPKLPRLPKETTIPFEEGVWVKTGAGRIQPLRDVSASLRLAKSRTNSERQLRVYIVCRDIKTVPGLLADMEDRLRQYVREYWNEFSRTELIPLAQEA